MTTATSISSLGASDNLEDRSFAPAANPYLHPSSPFNDSSIVSMANTNATDKSEESDDEVKSLPSPLEIKMAEYRENFNDLDIFGILNRWEMGYLDKEGKTNLERLKNDCKQFLEINNITNLRDSALNGETLRAKGVHDDLCGYIEFEVDIEKLTELLTQRIEEIDKIAGEDNKFTPLLSRHLGKMLEEGLTEHRKNGIRNDEKMICLEMLRQLVPKEINSKEKSNIAQSGACIIS